MAQFFEPVPLTATSDAVLLRAAQLPASSGTRLVFSVPSAWSGSVVLKADMAAPGQAQSLTSIPYLTASTGATNTAGTAITGAGDYIVQNTYDNYDLYAVYTHTSGSAVVYILSEDAAVAGAGPGGGVYASQVDGSGGSNTFGAAIPYTGNYAFPSSLTVGSSLAVTTTMTMGTSLTWTGAGSLIGYTASGTDTAATSTTFKGALSTGNATPAGFIWQTTLAGSTGATPQTLATRMTLGAVSSTLTALAFAAATIIQMGAAPGTTAAQNVDGASYSDIVYRAVNTAASDFRITVATGSTTIGNTTATTLNMAVGGQTKWYFAGAAGFGTMVSGQVVGRMVGGSTSFAIRDAADALDKLQVATGSSTVGNVTSNAIITKAVTAIPDNTATATFTITVPNAAHSASVRVTLVGSLGAGGAIGANEATGTVTYDIGIARTAGVNAVGTASAAYGSGMANVAGAATITVTAALSAVSGAVGATNTFTVNVTIARGSGASDNHTCFCYAQILNANATGITLS